MEGADGVRRREKVQCAARGSCKCIFRKKLKATMNKQKFPYPARTTSKS